MDKNIGLILNCYGCGVCAAVCPQKIISLSLNEDGFYEPQIDNLNSCTDCGLCRSVCSFLDDEPCVKNPVVASYAAWSKDSQVRHNCSSGGVSFEVGRSLISQGYKVCGVRYNPELNRAEHYIAEDLEELIQSIGSKYIQSYTLEAFINIDRKQKYLVVGAPCQIDSFRRYIKKFRCEGNFVFMDFYCHGVPSKLMWDKYLNKVKKKVGKVTYVSWRNKIFGWHDSWAMSIDGISKGKPIDLHESTNLLMRNTKSYYNSRLSQGDIFYRMFLSNACLGDACYEKCKYKACSSAADIRIGDLWGEKYKSEDKGVNAVLALTEKGNTVLCTSNLHLVSETIEVVAEGQMQKRTKKHPAYYKVMKALRNGKWSLKSIFYFFIYPYRLLHLPVGAVNRIKRLIKK